VLENPQSSWQAAMAAAQLSNGLGMGQLNDPHSVKAMVSIVSLKKNTQKSIFFSREIFAILVIENGRNFGRKNVLFRPLFCLLSNPHFWDEGTGS